MARCGSIVVKLLDLSMHFRPCWSSRPYGKLPAHASASTSLPPRCCHHCSRLTDFGAGICQTVWMCETGADTMDDEITEVWPHLFNVVDFPELGFPTSPIRGSRGMATTLSTTTVQHALRRLAPVE